jgi:hypothetical protein
MTKILKIIKDEIMSVIPAIIFFLITFNLIVFTENLMLEHTGASYFSYILATIGALIAGKFLIIVNYLRFINAFPNKPLIYNIIWKAFVYCSFALLFRIVEKSIDFSFKYEHLFLIYSHLNILLISPVFWAIQIWLSMLLVIYVIASEFVRVLGKSKINSLLFEVSHEASLHKSS